MNPEKWFEVQFVVFVVAFVLLLVAIPIYAGNEDLPTNAAVVGSFLVIATASCACGIAYAHKRRNKLVLLPLLVVTACIQIVVISVMITEWSQDDCDLHVFALCTNGEKNFFAVMLIDLIVQLFFIYQYKMIWSWKRLLEEEHGERIMRATGKWDDGASETDRGVIGTDDEEEVVLVNT